MKTLNSKRYAAPKSNRRINREQPYASQLSRVMNDIVKSYTEKKIRLHSTFQLSGKCAHLRLKHS